MAIKIQRGARFVRRLLLLNYERGETSMPFITCWYRGVALTVGLIIPYSHSVFKKHNARNQSAFLIVSGCHIVAILTTTVFNTGENVDNSVWLMWITFCASGRWLNYMASLWLPACLCREAMRRKTRYYLWITRGECGKGCLRLFGDMSSGQRTRAADHQNKQDTAGHYAYYQCQHRKKQDGQRRSTRC